MVSYWDIDALRITIGGVLIVAPFLLYKSKNDQ